MNFLKKMLGMVEVVNQPDSIMYQSPDAASEPVNEKSVLGISTAWACVNLLAGTIASLPLNIYKSFDDGRVEVAKTHRLYNLLHYSPNYDQTALDFWEYMVLSLELWGNAYAQKQVEGGKVVALDPINPALMSVRRLDSGSIEYTWTKDGRHHRKTDEEILHIRGFGGSPLGGLSTLHCARGTFSSAQALKKAASNSFENGATSKLHISLPEFVPDTQRELIYKHLREEHTGVQNANRPLITEGGTSVNTLTINPADAQMLESRGFSIIEVCQIFGVPPFMVGFTEKSTSWGTGIEQQTLAFQKFTLRRRLKRIEQALMKQLLTPAEQQAGFFIEFNLEGLLRGDSATRAAFYAAMAQNGFFTINEVRALENRPPVDGGDVPRMQMQNVPITEENNANKRP